MSVHGRLLTCLAGLGGRQGVNKAVVYEVDLCFISVALVHLSCFVELKQNILSSMVVWIAKLISIYIYTYMLFNAL